MDEKKILDFCLERGILLDKNIFELLKGFENFEGVESFLQIISKVSGKKMITKSTLSKNVSFVKDFVNTLPGGNKEVIENIIFKLGISLEVTKESVINNSKTENSDFEIIYANTKPDHKLEVKDFVGNFKARYREIRSMLLNRSELQNKLLSINRISKKRQALAIIGIVTEKNITKNKNLIVTFEDLTGRIKVLFRFDNKKLFEQAYELQLDDIVAIKGSGDRDIIFAQDLFWPDSFLEKRVKFKEDANIIFISDIHAGSNKHLAKSFQKFLNWINSDDPRAKKVKYIFIVGDNVDGVGIFPGQDSLLKLKSMQEQYDLLAFYLAQIPKSITMFMCPGQHDATRVAEPQPIIDRRYAEKLYELDNLILVTNPSLIKLFEDGKEFKILMYHGASIHSFINGIQELREMKAHRCPAKAVRHMLKRRHLAPIHGDSVYIPNSDKDPLVISESPDIFCTGEVHRMDIENYNGTIIITGSCWQAQTDFEEKVGNVPDPAKVCMVNLKSRELKLLDFRDESEIDENGAWTGGENGADR